MPKQASPIPRIIHASLPMLEGQNSIDGKKKTRRA